jgi:ligand-binding sensor domain-containing protein
MMRWHLVGIAALAACAGGAASEGGTSALTTARREERITIGAYNEIVQVTAGERLVFAASERGVIIYDALFRTWLPPLEMDDAFRASPTALAADPTEDAVWAGTSGRILYYRPRLDYAVTATLAGTPQEIFFDGRDLGAGAYVRAGNSFIRVTRTGSTAGVPLGAVPPPQHRLRSPTARDVFREFPTLETFLPLLTRGDDLEQWQASAATLAPGRSEVWLGTRGNGLFRVDPTFNRADHLPFGLLEPGVGALALAADGVWSGGLGAPGDRGGLVFASLDLQRWRWLDGPPSRPFVGTRVSALSIRERTAWIGTSRGLLRMELDDDNQMSRWDAADGLPSDAVTSVVAGAAGAWVGTTGGLAFVERSARAMGPRVAVRDLVLWTDTLWIASDAGVLALAPPDSVPHRLSVEDTRLTRAVTALARADSILAVATDAELIEIDLNAQRVLPPRAASFAALRRIVRLTMDAHTIWLAGEGGVLAIHRASGRSALLPVGLALPAAATAVTLSRDAAWIGTRDGLVRVRRRADGMPP